MELTNFILLSTCIKYGCINNPLFVFAQNRISVLVGKPKKNCYYNHIPSNWTINRKHFLSVLTEPSTRRPFRLHFNIPCKDFNICASIFYEETLYMYVRASILRWVSNFKNTGPNSKKKTGSHACSVRTQQAIEAFFLLPIYILCWCGVGGYLESNPFRVIEFLSREITPYYHISW